jgi:hypothetical protein
VPKCQNSKGENYSNLVFFRAAPSFTASHAFFPFAVVENLMARAYSFGIY